MGSSQRDFQCLSVTAQAADRKVSKKPGFFEKPGFCLKCVLAIPLLVLAVAFFGFSITFVRTDAGYFTYAILNFILTVLHASFVIDYNLRQGEKFLATHFFLNQ